jgi:SAM-dependent methyltransferase
LNISTVGKYAPILPIFREMQLQTLDGVALSEMVGGGDPVEVANRMIEVIRGAVGISSTDTVLDIGCGCGRVATALTQYLGASARYYGVDIVPGLIDFCRTQITPIYPNFQFFLIDQTNLSYDWYIKEARDNTISVLSDACGDQSIDLCIALSLFTHLTVIGARKYFAEIARVLKPDGRAPMPLRGP